MTNFIKHVLCLFLLFCLSSCATKEQTGAGLGAVTGGLVGAVLGERSGNAFVGATIGTIVGGLAGSAIGKKLDQKDKKLISLATQNALENSQSGKKIKWHNPDSGHEGYVTPVKTYQVHERYCREFMQEALVGGEKVKVYGRACRKPDGQWEIINSENDY